MQELDALGCPNIKRLYLVEKLRRGGGFLEFLR